MFNNNVAQDGNIWVSRSCLQFNMAKALKCAAERGVLVIITKHGAPTHAIVPLEVPESPSCCVREALSDRLTKVKADTGCPPIPPSPDTR